MPKDEEKIESGWDFLRVYGLKILAGLFVLIFIVPLFFSFWGTIPAGHRGVVLEFGKVKPEALGEGLFFVMPIMSSVVKMDVRTQIMETTASAASKDLQDTFADIAINFHLNPDMVTNIYQTVGTGYSDTLIAPAVQEVVKASTARYNAEQLITERPSVKQLIEDGLRERLNPRGIIVEQVSITNFNFTAGFNEAIELKVKAQQLALKAQNDLVTVQFEAQQEVTKANGTATAIVLKAVAEAEAIRITGDALRQNQQLIQLEAVKKWDGKLPITMLGGGVLPFIDIKQYAVTESNISSGE